MSETPNTSTVINFFKELQDDICESLSDCDRLQTFKEEKWNHANGGGGRSRVISNGNIFEQGGVNFSHVKGASLPQSASANRPELAGKPFEATGVSLVIHPHNPYVPTTHMNVRFFIADADSDKPLWWFGGGFDLTPFYGFKEDAIHWHQTAQNICIRYGKDWYKKYKKWCDDYFFLKHRNEARGIGGIFFDDLNHPDFQTCFKFTQDVGRAFLDAYIPIVNKRKDTEYSERERDFQCYRRGRYVEFNLVYDRGTLFGLQSGGRTESILMSMPPLVKWRYNWHPEAGTAEHELYSEFLPAKNWLKDV